ncbi:MAG: hypothetical protein GF381_02710 [Candidatus Pacebacteria bacterium]|nr:hypothetical protein [Candidatus Paceibacterota bacterium]
MALIEIIGIFGLIFAIGHIYVLKYEGKKIGTLLLVSSILSTLAFPFVIVSFQHGFIYSYMIHSLFYLVLSIAFKKRYAA